MISRIINKIIKTEKDHSAAEAALICTVITLTCSFWQLENYISPKVMTILNILAMVMMICGWLYFSFAEGVKLKSGFAVFTALYWIVPVVLYTYSDGVTDPREFNIAVYISAELSKLLGKYALENVPLLGTMSSFAAAVVFSSICILLCILGIILSKKQKTETA